MIQMGRDYSHIITAVETAVWAICEEKLCQIRELLALRAQGFAFDADEIQARIGSPDRREKRIDGATAIIPLLGVISRRQNLLTESSGGTSIEGFRRQFRAAVNDPQIGNILLDVDSPGGDASGVEEMADEIFEARKTKRIVAMANTTAGSGAFWLATAATEFVATASASVGSVGVFAIHEDMSAMEEKLGIKTSIIKAGKHKAEGHPSIPLTDEAREHMQGRVDEVYDVFVKSLAKFRGASVKAVRSDYGEGRMLSARRALQAGMIDRVATFDETIDRVSRGLPLATTRAESGSELEARKRRLRLAMAR